MVKKPITQKNVPSPVIHAAPRPPQNPKAELPFPIIKFAANNNVLYPYDAIEGTEAELTLPSGATDVVFYMAIKDQDEPALIRSLWMTAIKLYRFPQR